PSSQAVGTAPRAVLPPRLVAIPFHSAALKDPTTKDGSESRPYQRRRTARRAVPTNDEDGSESRPYPLIRRASAGDVEHAARGERVLGRRQPADERRDLLDVHEAPPRDGAAHVGHVLRRHLRQDVR